MFTKWGLLSDVVKLAAQLAHKYNGGGSSGQDFSAILWSKHNLTADLRPSPSHSSSWHLICFQPYKELRNIKTFIE